MISSLLFWARLLFAALFVLITYLTLTPNPDDVATGFDLARLIAGFLFGEPDYGDKVAHFAAYGALGAMAYWAQIFIAGRRWLTPVCLGFYGALLEGAQGIGGVRSLELLDAMANGLGAVTGFIVAAVFSHLLQQLRNKLQRSFRQ